MNYHYLRSYELQRDLKNCMIKRCLHFNSNIINILNLDEIANILSKNQKMYLLTCTTFDCQEMDQVLLMIHTNSF